MPSGKTGKAKENYLVLPCSESERNKLGISPALRAGWFVVRGQLSVEASLSRLFPFPFIANSCVGSHLASSPREISEGSRAADGEEVSYLL